MPIMLDYERRGGTTRPLRLPFIISLAGCPVASIAAAVFGCRLALSWLSPANYFDSVGWGLFVGVLGGLIVAVIARAFRSQAVAVSIVGSLIVTGVSGLSLFVRVSMSAAC